MRRVVLSILCFAASLAVTGQIDPDLLSGMKARSIGPASMSGRVAAIDAVASNPDIIWVGAATGGVWKSTNGGFTFTPVFDDQPVAAIGAIAINQASPDVVWVGTGEANVRNSASVGNGIYKTMDGGKTWQHLGLEKTERIGRIVLNPANPDVAWAAALGREWGENPERGVFKTTDGGKTWRRVLYVNERTGAADIAIDPTNPNKLFASMWEYRRWPWFFSSGGPGSGLYVSNDGGESWKRYTEEDGMPKGLLGRASIAVANSNLVYALVEAEKSALIRSDDGGKKWTTVNSDPDVAPRPFYFDDIRIDPKDPHRIYNLWTLITVSNDGGMSFQTLVPFSKVHPDHHAFWIDPNDPAHLLDGNDGGVAESRDYGRTWRFVATLPLGQYYHIAYDMDTPYNIYGGMQDNGSWRGPSAVWTAGGIRNSVWQEVGFGDGFATAPIPGDSSTGYSMSQEGYLRRWDLKKGERKDIRPPAPQGVELRFNWNSGFAVDPFDANAVYYGSQFLHKSIDRGETWKTISPDLTTNNPDWQKQDKSGGLTIDATGAENFTTIVSIAPSPADRKVIWAGTDDGRIQLTKDGGATWSSVEKNVAGVPASTWVPHIEASKSSAATAFAVFDDHRRSNWTTYVYRTDDFGKSWKSLAAKNVDGYALTIVQDPVDENLLFLGTEFGLWASLDGGKNWMKWTAGYPTVSTMALAIHPRENDLIVGTHGRSAYILDDITPLRTMSAATMAEPLHLFPVRDAQQARISMPHGARFLGDAEFKGENRPYGALVTFSMNLPGLPLPKEEKERERKEKEREANARPLVGENGVPQDVLDVPKEQKPPAKPPEAKPDSDQGPRADIRVADASGKLIRTFKVPVRLGVNRVNWDLTRDKFREPPREKVEDEDDTRGGPEVLPGTYKLTIAYEGHEASTDVRVVADPRAQVSDAARAANFAALQRAGAMQETIAAAVERIQKTRADLDAITAKLKAAQKPAPGEKPVDDPLVAQAKTLGERLDKVEKMLWVPPKTRGILPEKDALSKVSYVLGSLQSSWDAPTAAQVAYLDVAARKLSLGIEELNRVYATDVKAFRDEVTKRSLQLLPEEKPIEMPK